MAAKALAILRREVLDKETDSVTLRTFLNQKNERRNIMSKNKGTKKAKTMEEKSKKSTKAPKRVLEKVGTTKDSVSFISKPAPGILPSREQKPGQKANVGRSVSRPSEGEVKVISFDRIVLGKKWTEPLGLKEGDSVRIRREESSLVLTK